jgi:hypothetical protein
LLLLLMMMVMMMMNLQHCQYVDWPPLWSSGQSSWLQIQRLRVWFPALPDFLRSSGSGTGSTQPREDNWRPTWRDSLRWPRDTPYPLKLTLTSPTSGGPSVGIVRWRTKSRSLVLV